MHFQWGKRTVERQTNPQTTPYHPSPIPLPKKGKESSSSDLMKCFKFTVMYMSTLLDQPPVKSIQQEQASQLSTGTGGKH